MPDSRYAGSAMTDGGMNNDETKHSDHHYHLAREKTVLLTLCSPSLHLSLPQSCAAAAGHWSLQSVIYVPLQQHRILQKITHFPWLIRVAKEAPSNDMPICPLHVVTSLVPTLNSIDCPGH